uniref:HAT C-terminal dimerisation domain-containing protein n=1 Tax=Plectus sambesii TaxID=2011161 RepID=A0A914XF45_9BILA
MPNCSLNFLLSKQFCDLVETLNPKYCIPASRTKLTSLIENQLEQLKIKLQAALTGAVKFAVGLDLWITKGVTNLYLALTVHFFSPSAKRLMNLLLGLRLIVGRHSAATIKTMCNAMLAEWELKENDISRYFTDNGSNMITAFRDLTISISREIDEDSTTADEPQSSIFLADPNIEVESDDVEEEIDKDIFEFESCEEDSNSVFSKRLPCIAHTIQLVLHSTVDRDITFNRPIQHMLEILRKFKKSVLVTESLLNKCGKMVLLPAWKRWNSLCIVLERVFDIQRILNAAAPNFDPTYLISTLLDPNVAWMVENDVKFTVGKRFILAMIPSSNDNATSSISSPPVSMLLSSSQFSALAEVMASKRAHQEREMRADGPAKMLDRYFNEWTSKPPTAPIDPFEFWQHSDLEPLAHLTFEILAIPATTAPVERVFSQPGLCTLDRKRRTGPRLLEAKCMIHLNLHFMKLK